MTRIPYFNLNHNMKSKLLLSVIFLIHVNTFGQGIQSMPNRIFSTNIGLGKLGTGDKYGFMIGMEYEKQFRPKLSWSTELTTTIHDGYDLLVIEQSNGLKQDMSYRYTTAGVQLAGKLGYHFLRTKIADYGVKLGVLARYQSSSLANDREVIFPISTGYPFPVRILRNNDPQRTIAAGAILQAFTRYTFKKNITLGASIGLQIDTNQDVIFPAWALMIGKRF